MAKHHAKLHGRAVSCTLHDVQVQPLVVNTSDQVKCRLHRNPQSHAKRDKQTWRVLLLSFT